MGPPPYLTPHPLDATGALILGTLCSFLMLRPDKDSTIMSVAHATKCESWQY